MQKNEIRVSTFQQFIESISQRKIKINVCTFSKPFLMTIQVTQTGDAHTLQWDLKANEKNDIATSKNLNH